LATAYQAIRSADPSALVEDAGLSSTAFGLLVANDMFASGRQEEAVSFVQGYFHDYQRQWGLVRNSSDLQTLLSLPGVQDTIGWASLLFDNAQYLHALQVHYYAPWAFETAVTNWIHRRLEGHGGDKLLDFWESGYGWDDLATFDPQAQARDIVKLFVTAIGEGALSAVQFQFNDYAALVGHPGLWSDGGPRPAAQPFRLLAEKVNGITSAVPINLAQNVWSYRLDAASGPVYVVWSAAPTTIRAPFSTATVKVTAIDGNQTFINPTAVRVTESPLFIEAGPAAVETARIFFPLVLR
jgi:hypothetical protein